MSFLQPQMAWFFPVLGLFVLLYLVRRVRRKRDLANFSQVMANKQHLSLNGLRLALLCFSMVSLILAMMRPTWGLQDKVLKKEGRDVVFILDVSNSMRAEDVAPNRLERSKIAIAECVASLKSHRVGLVVFAGSASIKCPLTLDYEFFGTMLDEVDQSSVSHGGTRIEDALLKTCDKLFSDSKQGFKDIILISDGGDQGNQLEKAVNEITELGIKMIVIGVGDEKNGARIPAMDNEGNIQDGFMIHEKREVWTKLESQFLRQLAELCQGAYLPAGTKQMDLARIYEQLSTQMPTQELSEHSVSVPIERYSLFLGLGLALLIIMTLTPTSLKRVAQSASVLLMILTSAQLSAQEEEEFSAPPVKQFSPEMEKKRESYLERLERSSQSKKLTFEFAGFLFENGDFVSAVEWYSRSFEKASSADDLCTLYYNMGNAYYRIASELDDLDEVVEHLMMGKSMYRKVLNQNPEYNKASINLELTKRLIFERKKEQDERDKREQELQAELEKIKQELIAHIEEQALIQQLTRSKIEQFQIIDSLAEQQRSLSEKTYDTLDLYEVLRNNFFKDVPPEAFPFAESREFTRAAIKDENQASEDLLAQDHAVVKIQDSALENLRKALAALDQDQNQSQADESQDSDSDSSEEGEEGEEGDEESDEEGEDQSSADSAKMDLANQELPPPNQNPADIVKMEQQLQKMREANKKASKQKRVEKDW